MGINAAFVGLSRSSPFECSDLERQTSEKGGRMSREKLEDHFHPFTKLLQQYFIARGDIRARSNHIVTETASKSILSFIPGHKSAVLRRYLVPCIETIPNSGLPFLRMKCETSRRPKLPLESSSRPKCDLCCRSRMCRCASWLTLTFSKSPLAFDAKSSETTKKF